MKLSSSDSIFLVCTSARMAISFYPRPTAVRFDIPIAETSLLESLLCEGWNSEARAAGESIVSCIDDMNPDWSNVVRKVLDACGGLPAAAIAAGESLFQRKFAGLVSTNTRQLILSDLEGGVSTALNGRMGFPDALQTNLDRTLKFCKDSIASTHQFSLTLYRLIGSLKPSWIRSTIPNWRESTADLVIAISLSDLTSLYEKAVDGGGTDEVLRGLFELGKYLPISACKESGHVVMCPLVFDHTRFLSNRQKEKEPGKVVDSWFQVTEDRRRQSIDTLSSNCSPAAGCLSHESYVVGDLQESNLAFHVSPWNNIELQQSLKHCSNELTCGGRASFPSPSLPDSPSVKTSSEFDRRGWPEESLSGHFTTSELLRLDFLLRQTLGLCVSAECSPILELELRQEGESLRYDISAGAGPEEWRHVLDVGVRLRKWTEKVVAVRKAA